MRQLTKAYDPGLTAPRLLELVQHTTAAPCHTDMEIMWHAHAVHTKIHTVTNQKSSDKKKKSRQITRKVEESRGGREDWRVKR